MENNDSFTKLKESTQKLFDAQKKRLNNEDRIETDCQTLSNSPFLFGFD